MSFQHDFAGEAKQSPRKKEHDPERMELGLGHNIPKRVDWASSTSPFGI